MGKSSTKSLVVVSLAVFALGLLAGCGEAEKAPSANTSTKPADTTSVKEQGKQGGMVPDFTIDK